MMMKSLHLAAKKVCAISFIIGCLTIAQQVSSFGSTPTVPVTTTTTTTRGKRTLALSDSVSRAPFVGVSSRQLLVLSSKGSGENDDEKEEGEKEWSQEESLLVMNLSPLPDVSFEDSLSRVSQYIRSFPFAAVLPVQPLQALPTDDGGLELRFLRKKTHIKSGVDGGIRFFVHVRDDDDDDDQEDDSIEILVKRNSDGQSIPKMFAEKLVVQTFAKGMALGSDFGNDNNNSSSSSSTESSSSSSSIKVPNTRIESPTKDMVRIQSVFHKWI